MKYIMDSQNEGNRIELKTDTELTMSQLKNAGINSGDTVLDLGCAAGTISRMMARMVGASGKVIGVDASEQRLAQARSFSVTDSSIEYRHGQAENIPAADNEFDVSWSRFLFEYLSNPEAVFREMVRVTKPSGKVVVSDLDGNCVWHYPAPSGFERDLAAALETLGQAGFDPFAGRKLYSYAVGAGLSDIQVGAQTYHFYPGKINETAFFHWNMKLEIVEQSLIKLGWEKKNAAGIKKQFLSLLLDEMSFSYSVLITVKGVKSR